MRGLRHLIPLLLAAPSLAQPTAGLIGRVVDADTQQPLAGVLTEVLLPDTAIATETDELGAFRFTNLPIGVHALRLQHAGYATVMVPEAWARAGRIEEVTVGMHRQARMLQPFEVSGQALERTRAIGAHPFTVEQTLRYPATFLDPARLASTQAGTSAVNDQANHLSVRGHGPASTAYLLEGAEIVCPNHLTNAGTSSDLPTLSGGGVTILSAQMLGPSRLLTGSLGAAYGNALGGILDMRLRRGSSERQGFTLQAGLLGLDASAEGPITKHGRGTYLVNYRYSTLGLLSSMGVDLGDEVIRFQDLSFHASLPIARGSISFFGLGGISENRHAPLADTSAWAIDKDSQDIRYDGRMGAAGLSVSLPLGKAAAWRTTLVISENNQSRTSASYTEAGAITARSDASLLERKLSAFTRVNARISDRLQLEAGGSLMERTVEKDLLLTETSTGWLVRPFAQMGWDMGARLRVEAGGAYAHYTANGNGAWEPRASARYSLGERSSASISAGQRSQLPALQLFFVKPLGDAWDNSAIGPDRMQEAVIAFDHMLRPHLRVHLEGFIQQRDDVAIGDATRWRPPFNDDGSMANAWDQPLILELAARGRSRNTGAEASFTHDLHRGRYLHFNATALLATYTGSDGREREGRWSRGFILNGIAGREFTKRTEQRARVWGLNLRGVVAGGARSTPIDTGLSAVTGGTVFDAANPLSQQQGTYHRIDFRVYLRREHLRRSGQWSLDLQNILNTRNEAYRYYDHRQGRVVAQQQLGLIPNLSYRIDF